VFPLGFVPRVLVELTRLGRASARAGLGRRPHRGHRRICCPGAVGNLVKVAAAGRRACRRRVFVGRPRFYLGTGFRPHGAMSRGFIDTTAVRGGTVRIPM